MPNRASRNHCIRASCCAGVSWKTGGKPMEGLASSARAELAAAIATTPAIKVLKTPFPIVVAVIILHFHPHARESFTGIPTDLIGCSNCINAPSTVYDKISQSVYFIFAVLTDGSRYPNANLPPCRELSAESGFGRIPLLNYQSSR